MKKILTVLLIGMFILTAFCNNVYAKGSIKPSKTSMSIAEGSSGTFKVTASNAAGRIDISSSNSSVAKVNVSSKWLDNSSVTVTVTGKSVGTATITVRLSDAATYDEKVLSSTYKITVKVTEPKSADTSLETLKVENYKLVKENDTSYTLDVDNNVTSIKIIAAANDTKATVSGEGTKTLKVGVNTFNVVVTAESGAKKTYKITVTRKDGYYLDDLDVALKNAETVIKLKNDDVVTSSHLEKIKQSNKIVTLNSYDEDGKVVYGWKLDGSKITDLTQTNTNITFKSEYSEQIGALSNYAAGKIVHFKDNGKILSGSIVTIYVGDKYTDKNELNVYMYNEDTNTLTEVANNLKAKEGYLDLNIEEYADYLITRSKVSSQVKDVVNITDNQTNFKMIAIIEAGVIVVLLTVCVIVAVKKKNR